MTDSSVSTLKTLYECFKYSEFSSFMTDNPQRAEWSSQIVMAAHIFFIHCEVSVQIKSFNLPLPEWTLIITNFCCSFLPVGLNSAEREVGRRKWGAEKPNSLVVAVLRPPWYHVLLEQNWILMAQCPQRCHEAPCETAFVHLLLHSPCAMEDFMFSHYLSHIYFCSSENVTHTSDDYREESSWSFFAPRSEAFMPPGWGTVLLSLCKKSLEHKMWSDLFCGDIRNENVHICLLQKTFSLKLGWMKILTLKAPARAMWAKL